MSIFKKNKSILVGKTIDELKLLCEGYGYDKYRGEQLFNWIYKNYAIDFDSMVNIPKKFLNNIKDNYDLHSLNISVPFNQIQSKQIKYYLKLIQVH